jgi:hypothetical protein
MTSGKSVIASAVCEATSFVIPAMTQKDFEMSSKLFSCVALWQD